ncbi:beta-ketoacyl-ACP synthase III [Streptomyces montanisoli]|uniref:Beta-ketoacyl-[acyl-carrier-protein] synthase III n=1 Tax=Streptomyces montanisoli TaxID=2798581 RepID=A0A940RYK4_9ACTN|nr:beta-ketoacyl-ACP synthase III [Streptomyces montanisoli]MBP0458784.1 ketoacyl-ACP synthase III [Streptomyces montanisoli]
MSGRTAVLSGVGGWLPPRLVTNDDLAAQLDTSDEWITSRTGIRQRFVVTPGLSTSGLAVEAGRRALASAGTASVDLLVLATTTPDHPCPATAPEVAAALGLGEIPAFDVGAVCTGFLYALASAASMISAGVAGSALVIGADTFSTILDPGDRTTRAIFGDGAGAVVLRAGTAREPGAVLGFDLGSDGSQADLITVPGGGSEHRSNGLPDAEGRFFRMQGRSVFRNAVTRMSESCRALTQRVGWPVESVDRVVAHQANSRILAAVGSELGLPQDRLVVNLDRVGNTVAASIPLALTDAVHSGEMAPGDRVLLCAFGGGLTWGAAALELPRLSAEPLPAPKP